MRQARRWIVRILILALIGTGAMMLAGHMQRHPEDLPWTELDLSQPVGMFTGRKLAGLADDAPRCQALLSAAGVAFSALPPRGDGGACGHEGAVRLRPGGALSLRYAPAAPDASCSVAAALALWEWHVVQPAAREHLGQGIVGIEHLGTFSCRRINGRADGEWSEHARANAIDIAGFRLADGRRISILSDWQGDGAQAAFLRDVRDGACRLFATVLSPDYNAAHRDHLHFDQADRGESGWRACR